MEERYAYVLDKVRRSTHTMRPRVQLSLICHDTARRAHLSIYS